MTIKVKRREQHDTKELELVKRHIQWSNQLCQPMVNKLSYILSLEHKYPHWNQVWEKISHQFVVKMPYTTIMDVNRHLFTWLCNRTEMKKVGYEWVLCWVELTIKYGCTTSRSSWVHDQLLCEYSNQCVSFICHLGFGILWAKMII